MHINKMLIANAVALTTTFVWIVCSLGVALFPRWAYQINLWWTHGMYASPMGDYRVTLLSFFLGGFLLVGFSWITGYVFGISLEMFAKKR